MNVASCLEKMTKMKATKLIGIPSRELEDMQHRLSTVLGRQLNRRQDGDKESITVAEWAPAGRYYRGRARSTSLKSIFPEIKKEEVKVTVENGVLVLSGERKLEIGGRGREIITVLSGPMAALGAVSALPDNADAEKVDGYIFNDGVLKLHIAKREAARPRAIEVKIS